jgi:hypothetical protein
MTAPLRLFDLFGEPTAAAVAAVWSQRVQPTTGFPGTGTPPDLTAWLAALNQALGILDVRTGADGDRVTAEANLTFHGSAAYPEGFPFVLAAMPDVEFRILDPAAPPDQQHPIRAFASVSDSGVELVLEQLPVEIRLPSGLVESHPRPGGGIADGTPGYDVGEFHPNVHLDDLKIHYDRGQPSSVFVHIRLHMNEQGEFDIRPAVPVSFGKCLFSGIPALAVHDFQLLPSPSLAPREVHWLRHDVTPWSPALSAPLDGLFSVRSLHVDPDTAPLKDLADFLHSRRNPADTGGPPPAVPAPPPGVANDAHAEFVLDDLVVPFYAVYGIPIPRHITTGVRRRILDKDDPKEVFAFDNAPVRAYFTRSPETGLIVDSFFFTSLPGGVGLTFDAAFVFGDTHDVNNKSKAMALGIGLEEEYTFTVSYKREFSTTTGLPAPGTGAAKVLNALLHFEIATNTVDIMTIRLGYSLGRHFQQHAGFADSAVATVDLFVTMPPSADKDSFVKLRSLNGEIVKFVLEGLGWRLGSWQVEGATLPDGVALVLGDVFSLVLQELGLRAEDNASYVSISGGVQLKIPPNFSGGLLVKRLRARFAGSKDAPHFKLDGFFLTLEAPGFGVDAGGYYTQSSPAPDTTVKEFALTGTVRFGGGAAAYKFGFDFLIGHTSSPAEAFEYLFAQVFFTGSIPLGAVDLRGVRALFARDMKPQLEPVDRDSRELRYYTWYKRSDPLTVPGDRRIAAWAARNDSLAFGLGASVSFPGLDSTCELTVFVLFVTGADEHALLIVVEVRLLHNPKPVGYLAVEYDFRHDQWRGVLGVDLRLSDFDKHAPDWMDQIGALTGTVFIGNHPPTFAIGRLADQRTWLLLHLDYDLWVRSFFEMGLCLEFVKKGPHGVGFFIRIEGGINAGIVRVVYHAGFGFSFAVFSTGSHDYAAEVWIEAALRVVLFGFLHYGISASATFRTVGSHPSRGELQLQVRLETPWFLPDVTWTLDIPFGTLSPGDLSTSTSPLRAAGGTAGLNLTSAAVHVERFDQAYADDRASRTFSVNELKAGGPDESARLANFAADTSVHPIAIDSTLAVEFAVAVNDKLTLANGVEPNLGDQHSGDLDLTYDLVAITVRRRARYGTDRNWHPLDQLVELPPDFSDPNGVKLTGALSAETITAQWDLDETIGDKPATKRLLLNSSTPFHFVTSNPGGDEELVRTSPLWPCCDRKQNVRKVHQLSFVDERIGTELSGSRLFSGSRSTLRFSRPAIARPQRVGTLLPGRIVADIAARPGLLAHIDFTEDVAYCSVFLGWSAAQGLLALVALDAAGKIVGSQTVSTASPSDFQTVTLGANAPVRRVELRVVRPVAAFQPAAPFVEIDSIVYISLTDQLDFLRREQACDDAHSAYEGKGKLFFLPNHDYEIGLTTRVTVAHPSTEPVSADVPEFLYFATKGLPGLNQAQRVGEEVEQYVNGSYGGGRGFLYRREPVVLAFKEDFFVAVPLALRPAGTFAEHTTLMQMQLVTRPDTSGQAGTPFTATDTDWIVAHRGTAADVRVAAWDSRVSLATTRGTPMRSGDPFRARLAMLTQRASVDCGIADPRTVSGTVLLAPPQGETDPDDPSRQLWPASQNHTATVRMAAAAFVERIAFDAADLTALRRCRDDGSADEPAWDVVDGVLGVSDGAGNGRHFAVFGDPGWNHFSVTVSVGVLGAAAGVAIALPGSGAPAEGLFALIEATGDGKRLVIYRRTAGLAMTELARTPLSQPADPAAPVSLQVTAYDDRIQATVGAQSIDAERDEQREGRVALVAVGAAEFRNLRVAGVPIYAFPYRTSRYRSFHEHVLSWPRRIDTALPDALGTGTTTSSTAALWAATQADIVAAMRPDAPAAARDNVFGRWLKELGLALKDDVTALEVTRQLVNGKTATILLESDEPIDFTMEVTAVLEQRIETHVIVDPPPGVPPRPVIDDGLLDLLGAALADRTTVAPPVAPSVTIRDVSRHPAGLDVEFAVRDLPVGALADDRVLVVESAGSGRLRLYTGRISVSATGARVRTHLSDDVTVLRDADSIFHSALDGAAPGHTVVLLPGVSAMGGRGLVTVPIFTYVPVDVHVLQSGSARQALIVPMSTADEPDLLAPGTYRLTLTINRSRWSTTDMPDDLNHYTDSATLLLEFG